MLASKESQGWYSRPHRRGSSPMALCTVGKSSRKGTTWLTLKAIEKLALVLGDGLAVPQVWSQSAIALQCGAHVMCLILLLRPSLGFNR